MRETDIEILLEAAKEKHPQARPRVISDNGLQIIGADFKEFIRISGMKHFRTSPYSAAERQAGASAKVVENGTAKLDHSSGLVFRRLPPPSNRRHVVYSCGALLGLDDSVPRGTR